MPRPKLKIESLRKALANRRVYWTGHAKRQLLLRSIKRSEALLVIQNGSILEPHPDATPNPKCLMMGFVRNKEPLYVSLAFDGDFIIIITVHWMDSVKWVDPWTRR